MATIKDFILKSGLQVNTSITVAGIDVLANDYSTYTTLQGELASNDYATYTTLQGELAANDYNTYTTLIGNFAANDYATLLAAYANDLSTYSTLQGEYRANDYNSYVTLVGLINAVEANVGGGSASANANDYNTYTTLVSEYRANDYATYTTLQSELAANDVATLLAAYANDITTLDSARANDYTTYTTLQGEFAANDYSTLLSAYANDYSSYTTLQGEFAANDLSTYSTLQGEYRANDYTTYTTLQGELASNDYATLLAAYANDITTLNSARANDYSTYTTLVNEYSANDYNTYTTLQGELRANDYATWSGLNSAINIKANSSVNVVAGDGINGGGDLTANVNISVDSTVVRTSGDQSIAGIKTFSDNVVVLGDLTVEGNTTTIGTTSLLVSDKFIELAANTTGTPAGDVGIYLNRGDFGNSAIYYDQAGGYFAIAETLDPATNTTVHPTSFANLRVRHLQVGSSDLVTNLNADLLDGESGAYYLDFSNASNTDYITLSYVTANGAITTDAIEVGGLAVDTDTLYVDAANDRVGVNSLFPAAEFQVSNAALSTSIVVTTATSAAVLDAMDIADFRTAKYLVQAHDTVTNNYQTSEILLIHDGSTAYLTEYAIIYTSGSLGSFDAAIVGGDVRLNVTPASTNSTTFKAYRQALTI
jgi:hypothetical protein